MFGRIQSQNKMFKCDEIYLRILMNSIYKPIKETKMIWTILIILPKQEIKYENKTIWMVKQYSQTINLKIDFNKTQKQSHKYTQIHTYTHQCIIVSRIKNKTNDT